MGILKWLGLEQPVKPEPPQEVKSYNDNVILNDGTVITANETKDYVKDGFNTNADVFSIVSLAARKFGQVPWYVYKVKKGKTKELNSYKTFSANNRNPARYGEMISLRKKAIEDSIVENDLSELLIKPNRNQGQDSFFETLYGYKLLTGEGNIWKNRGNDRGVGKVVELNHIPKKFLEIKGRMNDAYQIDGWRIEMGAFRKDIVPQDLIMWKFPCYLFDPATKLHLRGQPPLLSMRYDLEAGNENAKNKLKMNKSQGSRGLLYDATEGPLAMKLLTPEQQSVVQRAIDKKINSNDVASSIAFLQGKWGYHALGLDAQQLKMIEQGRLNTQTLCAGFNVPYEFFNPETTFANKEQAAKHFLYNHIAPAVYSLRDELNRSLLKDFGLLEGQYIIEPDISGLPEAMEDLQKQVTMLSAAWWLTPNQKLEKMGEDKSPDANMDKIYIPSSLRTLEDANVVTGRGLDGEEEVLNQNGAI
ncbi:MAG: phage portal protein [Agriterribacter sp.]